MSLPWSHILLDLDGTLINSTEIFYEVDRRVFRSIGIELLEEDFLSMQMEDGFKILLGILDKRSSLPHEEKTKLIQHIINESVRGIGERVDWFPDVQDFVKHSKVHGISLGIVTRSNTRDITTMEKRIPVRSLLSVIVQGEDTKERHKPHPYPLLLAAERLGVNPASCLYIGDHQDDLRAAKAAGMGSCIILRNHVPRVLADVANHAIHTLSDLYDPSRYS